MFNVHIVTIGGVTGEKKIVEKFCEVFSKLYNSAGTGKEMSDLNSKISSLIKEDSVEEVKKITSGVMKKTTLLMKSGKGDVSGGFTSDAILNAPDKVFASIGAIYQIWLVHGTVTMYLSAFLPLLKSALKDPADTRSYSWI